MMALEYRMIILLSNLPRYGKMSIGIIKYVLVAENEVSGVFSEINAKAFSPIQAGATGTTRGRLGSCHMLAKPFSR